MALTKSHPKSESKSDESKVLTEFTSFHSSPNSMLSTPVGGFQGGGPKVSDGSAYKAAPEFRSMTPAGTRFIRTIQDTMIKATETQKAALVASPGPQRTTSFWISESSYIINHSSSQMIWWTAVIFFLTIFTAVVTPVEVAFLETKVNFLFVLNRFMDFLFLSDIGFNLNLSYQDSETGMVVKERRRIVLNYVSFWFWMDLISMIPYDLISWGVSKNGGGSNSLKNVKLLRIIRLFRLMKLLRIFRAGRLFQTYQMDFAINYNTFALVKFLITITFIIHLMTCGLVFIETIYLDDNGDTLTWQDVNEIRDESSFNRYIWAMYWSTMTVSTIGYGDVSLSTQYERIYASICMMIGATAYAFIVGQLCNLIVNLDKEGVNFRNQLSDLNRFMAIQGLPQALQVQVRHFFGHTKAERETKEQAKNLESLSPGLRSLVLISMNQKWMLKIPFFRRHIHGDFVSALAKKVEINSFAPKEKIVTKHQPISKMFIVDRGMVIYRSATLFQNDFFGEEIVCSNIIRHRDDAIAFQYASVRTLRKKDLSLVLRKFKTIHSDVRRYAVKLRFRQVGAEVIRAVARRRNSAQVQLVSSIRKSISENRTPRILLAGGGGTPGQTSGQSTPNLVLPVSMNSGCSVKVGSNQTESVVMAMLNAQKDRNSFQHVTRSMFKRGKELLSLGEQQDENEESFLERQTRRQSFFDPSRALETEEMLEQIKQDAEDVGKASSIEDLDSKMDAMKDELSAEFDAKIRLLEQELGARMEQSFQDFFKELELMLTQRGIVHSGKTRGAKH